MTNIKLNPFGRVLPLNQIDEDVVDDNKCSSRKISLHKSGENSIELNFAAQFH
jgi:hypothetical protein